jgi:hypothetical protein
MTKFDIESFRINHSASTDHSSPEMYYAGQKDHEFIDDNNFPRVNTDSDKVLAKALRNKKSKHMDENVIGYSYYLKILPNKTLIDSRQLYKVKDKEYSHIDFVCRSDQEFLEVSHDTFQKYINFLKTENIQWLNKAQQDIK